jgi:drug/metabolite transporter (DMT)-like permease
VTFFALSLVLSSALLHAVWNLFAKRVSGGLPFVWLISLFSMLIWAPILIVAVFVDPPHLGLTQILFLCGTCALHVAYYVLLNRGYQAGDLSLVYPLARGTGPILAAIGAVVLLQERPSPIAIIGIVLIAVGVFVLTGDPRKIRAAGNQQAVLYGLLTGLSIAVYTIWDKEAVSTLSITPLILLWVSSLGRSILLTPMVLPRWNEVRETWSAHRGKVLWVAVLDPLSYLLFLTALVFSPVSYLAPARQLSILLGALLGTRVLAERDARRRLAAVSAMMVGLVILALG